MIKYRSLVILFLFMCIFLGIVHANDYFPAGAKPLFTPPVRIPIYLSANFMELRTDHFHSGIDIKTQGKAGIKIFSVAKGYVSRIKISTSGFGKAVYITHPNGYTSVYAHLSRMAKKITPVVRNAQYKRRSYTLDLFLSPGEIPVDRGELIGYSGNTGNSFGPHLHFEIRDSQTEHPVNPLKFSFPVKDTTSPVFHSIMIYPHTSGTFINNLPAKKKYKVRRSGNHFLLSLSKPVTITGPVSIGIEVQDYLNGSHNRCGIYDLQILIDERMFYHIVMDEFSYYTTRYINTLMDYREKIRNGHNLIRTYISPNNRLTIYRTKADHGIIHFKDMKPHKIEIIAADINGNMSHMQFTMMRTTPPLDQSVRLNNRPEGTMMLWDRENKYSSENCEVIIPEDALYDTLDFHYKVLPQPENCFSPVYRIHEEDIPLQRAFTLRIKPDSVNPALTEKMLLASTDKKGNLSAAGGIWENGTITGTLRRFGSYTVTIDSIAPQIKPLFRDTDTIFTGKTRIAFKISDNFSGIKTYNGFIDGKWVLFEYDPKMEMIWYTFDPVRLEHNKSHQLKLTVSDQKENKTVYSISFYW